MKEKYFFFKHLDLDNMKDLKDIRDNLLSHSIVRKVPFW